MDDQEPVIRALLDAYANGIFPMADARSDTDTYWVEPLMRGIIPLDHFNVPRSLKKFMAHCDYKVTFNKAFDQVINNCAIIPRDHEKGTWINQEIELWFQTLHNAGHAHSVEVWTYDNTLIGGLYGLAQGGCFNGESMFSHQENASKIALVKLVERLNKRGFTLLDTQFVNNHLKQFGCIEIPKDDYMKQLHQALELDVTFI
jgi:leucyl/phenylalanyl-tRNA--protein transferase